MRNALTLVVVGALAILLAGCGGGLEKAVIGKYQASLDSSGMKAEDKAALPLVEPMIKSITLDLKEGGAAEMKAMNETKKGTWKLDGTKLTVMVEGEKDPAVLEVEDGGKTLVPDEKAMKMGDMRGAKLTFKKAEAAK